MEDSANAPSPPERRTITTRREYLAAFDELLAGVRRELRIFDPDGAQLELGTPDRARQLHDFLLANRDNRLFVAVHDPEHIRRSCPRLLTLLTQFSVAIAIHQTEGEALRADDCFALADMAHFVRRPVAAAARG